MVRFAIVGLTNTLLDYVLFIFLHYATGFGVVTANLLSSSVAVVWSFFFNRHWTFADRAAKGALSGQFARHILTAGGAVLLSTFAVWLAARILPAYLAKIAAVALTFTWNFTLSRHWVFAGRR
jgi:putative flippase GtrA